MSRLREFWRAWRLTAAVVFCIVLLAALLGSAYWLLSLMLDATVYIIAEHGVFAGALFVGLQLIVVYSALSGMYLALFGGE